MRHSSYSFHTALLQCCLAMLHSRGSDTKLFLWSMLTSKLILSLEILWGLFNKSVGASYSSGNTVDCWTRTVLLFVRLHWVYNTIIYIPVWSRGHFFKHLYIMACHIHENRAIWYSMWFAEEIRKLFLLNSSTLKNFLKQYDKNLLSFVQCCSLPCRFFSNIAFMGEGFRK